MIAFHKNHRIVVQVIKQRYEVEINDRGGKLFACITRPTDTHRTDDVLAEARATIDESLSTPTVFPVRGDKDEEVRVKPLPQRHEGGGRKWY